MSTWTPVQYKVTFDADEGIFADTSLGTYVCQQAVHTAYSLPPSAPVLAGHRSEGWWTETVGGTKVTPSTAVVLTKAHTLYAHWTPDEPIPELPPTASEADVRTALEGSADARLLENITDAATYGRYREWAMGIGADAVKGAENSWISFAVDSATLLVRVPTDGDLKIEEFGPSSSEEGAFDFTVSVNGVGVGFGATDANLKKVFGLGGTTRIGEEEFDPDQVSLEFGTPVGGRLKFTAAPKDRTVRAFFMKMKVN